MPTARYALVSSTITIALRDRPFSLQKTEGDRQIDIQTRNHSQSLLSADGRITLTSNGTVSGDALFTCQHSSWQYRDRRFSFFRRCKQHSSSIHYFKWRRYRAGSVRGHRSGKPEYFNFNGQFRQYYPLQYGGKHQEEADGQRKVQDSELYIWVTQPTRQIEFRRISLKGLAEEETLFPLQRCKILRETT